MNAVLDQLRLLSAGLSVGTSTNGEECPFCSGGRGRERSLSLRRVDEVTVLYRCWRASCGRFGRIGGAGYTASGDADRIAKPRPVFSGDTRELGEGWLSELHDRYGFMGEYVHQLGWRESCEEQSRLVVPIRGPDGLERGVETRAKRGVDPKTLHYRSSDDVWMGWYGPKQATRTAPVVLVEDVLSAAKVGLRFRAASLMGSHVSLDHCMEAAGESDNVILALDSDATEKALKYRRRFALLCSLVVVPLKRDLKYETPEDIVSILTT